jgi:chromosome segregation ATPase
MIENSNINLGVFNEKIMQEQNNIANYETQLSALPDLANIQKKIDDAVKEYRELQSSTPRTARDVQNRENRLAELNDIEMNARRQHRDVSAQINSLTSRISSARTNIRNIELQREREISNSREKVIQNYIKNLHDNINNFYQWKDFFDNKNTVIKDFLITIDIRGHLIQIIDEYIPQLQVPTYQNLLTIFLNGWGI